jgi:hypothetical protein
VTIGGGSSGGKVWRTISILPGNIFLRQNLNEEKTIQLECTNIFL